MPIYFPDQLTFYTNVLPQYNFGQLLFLDSRQLPNHSARQRVPAPQPCDTTLLLQNSFSQHPHRYNSRWPNYFGHSYSPALQQVETNIQHLPNSGLLLFPDRNVIPIYSARMRFPVLPLFDTSKQPVYYHMNNSRPATSEHQDLPAHLIRHILF